MQNLNTIICSDNLQVLKQLPGKVDLVYLDPPFAIGSEYEDMGDDLGSVDELVRMLRPRVIVIRELLAESGSFYCHCDWHSAAYLQVFLDEIFGRQNLIAKIIWQHSSKISTMQRFVSHTYDVILVYGKSPHVRYFPQYIPYSDDEKETQYKYVEEETGKRYRLVNLTSSSIAPSRFTYEFLGVERNWRISKERMEEEFKQGRIVQSKPGSVPMRKQYINEGKLVNDVWTDINILSVATKEKTGYPTQKPLALLQRIVEMSTEKGDVVLDPFCGSGTSLVAAEKLGRKWIGIDISPTACEIATERIALERQNTSASEILQFQDKRAFKEIRNLPAYEFESWVISALNNILKNDPVYAESKGWGSLSGANVYPITIGLKLNFGIDFSARTVPVMVKQKEKAESKDVSNFAIQLNHHKQKEGIYVALSFLKSARTEAEKKVKEGLHIILITAKELLRT